MIKVALNTAIVQTTACAALRSTLLRAALVLALWAVPAPAHGQIYVTRTDATGRIPAIGEYTTAGAVVNAALISAGSAGPLWSGVALSGSNLFVMGFTGIGKYTTAGATLNASFITGLTPSGIAVSDDGATLFVADTMGTIGTYNALSGAAVNRALITGLAATSGTVISPPSGIAVSGSDLYVVNPGLAAGLGSIGKYTTEGATVNASLITGLTWPANIAVSGTDLFVTMGRATGSIGKYTTAGATVNATLAVVNGYPQGIAVSGLNLFVVYDYNNSVGEFTLSGETAHDPLIMELGGAQGIAVALDSSALTYDLTLNADPPAGGSITANPAPGADGKYAAGTTVNLRARAAEGYNFKSWTGVDSSNFGFAQVLMSGPRSVTGRFTDCGCPILCLVYEYLPPLSSMLFRQSPFQKMSLGQPSVGQIDLPLLYAFRDQVLARSTQGQAIVDMFYKFSPEIIYHLATTPDLPPLAAQAILNLQPLMRDMVAGTGELTVASNQVGAVTALIGKLNEVAGVDLKEALQTQVGQLGSLDSLIGKSSAQARLTVLGIQLQIINPKINSTGGLELTVTGVLPAGTFRAESSDDLTQWNVLSLAPVTALPVTVRDDRPVAVKQRYYRVVVAP